jgi:hypothetical protein
MNKKNNKKVVPAYDKGTAALSGASTGFAIGSVFSPIGGVIGGAIGAVGGLIFGSDDFAKRQQEQNLATMAKIKQSSAQRQSIANAYNQANLMNDPYERINAYANGTDNMDTSMAAVSKGEIIRQNGKYKDLKHVGPKGKDKILVDTTEDFAVLSNNTIPGTGESYSNTARAIINKYGKGADKSNNSIITSKSLKLNKQFLDNSIDKLLQVQSMDNQMKGRKNKTKSIGDTKVIANDIGWGNLISTGISSLASIYGSYKAKKDIENDKPETVPYYQNPYGLASISAMSRSQYPVQRELSRNNDAYKTLLYNAKNVGNSVGNYQGYGLAAYSQYNQANANTYDKANQFNQERNLQVAQAMQQYGQQDMAMRMTVDDQNAQARARYRDNVRAAEQNVWDTVGTAVQDFGKYKKQQDRDEWLQRYQAVQALNSPGANPEMAKFLSPENAYGSIMSYDDLAKAYSVKTPDTTPVTQSPVTLTAPTTFSTRSSYSPQPVNWGQPAYPWQPTPLLTYQNPYANLGPLNYKY